MGGFRRPRPNEKSPKLHSDYYHIFFPPLSLSLSLSWNNGSNHLIFTMLPWQQSHPNATIPVYNYGKALLMGGAFTVSNYRPGYDISIPVFNPLTIKYDYHQYHDIK